MTRQSDDMGHDAMLAELDDLLSTWGGDSARWPENVRDHIAVLLQHGPAARRLLAEAKALDRVLDTARVAPARMSRARSNELTNRILAAATETSPAAAPAPMADNVVAFAPRPRAPRQATASLGWQAAGMIAASLLAGVYLGGTFNMSPVLQELAEAVGISSIADPSIAALGDDLSDEDTL